MPVYSLFDKQIETVPPTLPQKYPMLLDVFQFHVHVFIANDLLILLTGELTDLYFLSRKVNAPTA